MGGTIRIYSEDLVDFMLQHSIGTRMNKRMILEKTQKTLERRAHDD